MVDKTRRDRPELPRSREQNSTRRQTKTPQTDAEPLALFGFRQIILHLLCPRLRSIGRIASAQLQHEPDICLNEMDLAPVHGQERQAPLLPAPPFPPMLRMCMHASH